jgi:hypothetical protein
MRRYFKFINELTNFIRSYAGFKSKENHQYEAQLRGNEARLGLFASFGRVTLR